MIKFIIAFTVYYVGDTVSADAKTLYLTGKVNLLISGKHFKHQNVRCCAFIWLF